MKKIVVAADGSEPASHGLGIAAQLAAQTGAELSLVAVKQITIDLQMERFAKLKM